MGFCKEYHNQPFNRDRYTDTTYCMVPKKTKWDKILDQLVHEINVKMNIK